jgi:hypothetical protein
MNLYLVVLHGLTMFKSYVVAENPDIAYRLVREWLDKEAYGARENRELDYVQLLTNADPWGSTPARLFIQWPLREKTT